MKDKLMKNTALYSAGFFTIAMCSIFFIGANKEIKISHVSQDEVIADTPIENSSDTPQIPDNLITFDEEITNTEYLCIPLPENIEAENITIENHYMDRELCIVLSDVDSGYYRTHSLGGNHKDIVDGSFENKGRDCILCLNTKGIFEYKTILEDNELYVSFITPGELYEKIVVIDPSHGGNDAGAKANEFSEKDIVLEVTKKLKEKLDATDIKTYYTRMDDVNPAEESRIALANETKADMYIRIEVSNNADTSIYGVECEYNDEFFIPGFGSVELSDNMETEVVTAIKGKALGLVKAPSQSTTLRKATVPATTLKVGCITNKQEAALLGREDYVDRIAEGIYNGIVKSLEDMK